jgi:hypothetical protein
MVESTKKAIERAEEIRDTYISSVNEVYSQSDKTPRDELERDYHINNARVMHEFALTFIRIRSTFWQVRLVDFFDRWING